MTRPPLWQLMSITIGAIGVIIALVVYLVELTNEIKSQYSKECFS